MTMCTQRVQGRLSVHGRSIVTFFEWPLSFYNGFTFVTSVIHYGSHLFSIGERTVD
jgi:hypothetical protein